MKAAPESMSCEKCGKVARRQISLNSAFHLQGTCWSRDRYTSKSNLKYVGNKDD